MNQPLSKPKTEEVKPKVEAAKPKAMPPKDSADFKDWCLSEERLTNLKKELDKRIAIVKRRVVDASYSISITDEESTISFLGGAEKEVCLSLIQADKSILSLFALNRIFNSTEFKESAMDKLERLSPEKLDKLLELLDKD